MSLTNQKNQDTTTDVVGNAHVSISIKRSQFVVNEVITICRHCVTLVNINNQFPYPQPIKRIKILKDIMLQTREM